jgi:hypothetical protein
MKMIISKTENIKIKKLKKYFTDGDKPARVKITTYWLLFVPVYTSSEITELLSN